MFYLINGLILQPRVHYVHNYKRTLALTVTNNNNNINTNNLYKFSYFVIYVLTNYKTSTNT